MKRLIVLSLLCTLAVATIFAATSCKGKTIFGSGIPKEPGDYLDRGNGWEKITSAMSVQYAYPTAEVDKVALPVRRGCQSIRYAHRFAPTEITEIGSFLFQMQFDKLVLCPGKNQRGNLEWDWDNALYGRQYDHSKYEGEDRYILIEYPLPDSPTGKYLLGISFSVYQGYVGLQRQ